MLEEIPTDNILSAYPVQERKEVKNKTGNLEAFEDPEAGGFNYNNFMFKDGQTLTT